jgi:transposase-like protein
MTKKKASKTVKKKSAKMGRPSAYREEYCEKLVNHGKQGLSFEAFAGEVGVCKDTLYEWVRRHEKFSYSKRIAESHSRLFWEKLTVMIATGKIQGASAAITIFALKNRLGWRDRQPDEAKDSGFEPVIIELPTKGKTMQIENKNTR